MSTVTLEQIKEYLPVIHNSDDAKLQLLIDGAEDEALQFLDRDTLPRRNETAVDECDSNQPEPVSDSDDLAPVVRMGIYLIVQGMYDGSNADEMTKIRKAAETKWFPYRNRLGF
jgi:Phage gp6-like head-tail connector protein